MTGRHDADYTRMKSAADTVCCARCRADVDAKDARGRCPICGLPVARSIAKSQLEAATARVEEDVKCTFCGYNLRTLLRSGDCPECGGRVAPSLVRREPATFGVAAAWIGYLTPLVAIAVLTLVGGVGPCPSTLAAVVIVATVVLTPMSFVLGTIHSAASHARGPFIANVIGLGWCVLLGLLLSA